MQRHQTPPFAVQAVQAPNPFAPIPRIEAAQFRIDANTEIKLDSVFKSGMINNPYSHDMLDPQPVFNEVGSNTQPK